jgi:hypothetical protein
MRFILSRIAVPVIQLLNKLDMPSTEFGESLMITGLSGTAIKPLL